MNIKSRTLTSKHLRHALYRKAEGLCTYCKAKLDASFHADHVIPYRLLQRTNPHELVASCATCNLKKGGRYDT